MSGALLAAFWWEQSHPAELSVPRAPSTGLAPTGAPVPRDEPPEQADEDGTPLPPPFSDGFCGADGEQQRFTVRHTLSGLLNEEGQRRLAALPDDATRALVMNAAHDFLATGRVPGGVSAADVLLVSAVGHWSPTRMLGLAEQVAQKEPGDPYLQVARAEAAARLDRPEVELDALRQARRGLPKSPAVGIALALALRDTPELNEAVAGLDTYLAVDRPTVLSRLRARMTVQMDIQRDYVSRTSEGVTLLSPPSLPDARAEAILGAIVEALDTASRRFGIPRRSTLLAVAYPGRSEILAVTCVQRWAGAVYDGTLRLVATPDQPMAALSMQLRHEATHAALGKAGGEAPYWFEEGTAQFFAGEPVQRDLWQAMVRNRTWVPFESLDETFQIFDKGRDADLAYAESRALVEFMASRGGDRAIADAVQAFRQGAKTAQVLAHANGEVKVTGEDLLAFLAERLRETERR